MRTALRPVAPLWIAAVALSGCSRDHAISTSPVGDPAYGVSLRLEPTNLPRGSVRFIFPRTATSSVRDTVRVTLRGLDTLENGFYTVWLGDSLARTFKRATGTLTVTRTDTVIDPVTGDPSPRATSFSYPNTSAFQRGGPRHSMEFVTNRTASGLAASDSIQMVLVTIEGDATAASPSPTRRPLWAFRSQGTDATIGGVPNRIANFRFGYFSARPESLYVFVPSGRGRVEVRGSVMLVNDSALSRPPLGYYYAAYAVKRDTAQNPVDTLFLGPQTAPWPRRHLSLQHADSLIVDPIVQLVSPPAILAASSRISADSVSGLGGQANPYRGFAEVFVTLESKNKDPQRMGPAILLRATIPDIVRVGPP
jgi:hypothetical protein